MKTKVVLGFVAALFLFPAKNYAGYGPTRLVVVHVEMKDGTATDYVSVILDSGHRTTSVKGELIDSQGEKSQGKSAQIVWGKRVQNGVSSPIMLDLSKPSEKLDFDPKKNQRIFVEELPETAPHPTSVMLLAAMDKKCSSVPQWKEVEIESVLSIEFYFQLTDDLQKKINEQFSFTNHFNQCEGSKLDMGYNPYPLGQGYNYEWLYQVPSISFTAPRELKIVRMYGPVDSGTIIAFGSSKNWIQMRNAAIILCGHVTNGELDSDVMTNEPDMDPKDFADLPAKYRTKGNDGNYHQKELYQDLWENVPKELKVEKTKQKISQIHDNGTIAGFDEEFLTLLKKWQIRCDYESSWPSGI